MTDHSSLLKKKITEMVQQFVQSAGAANLDFPSTQGFQANLEKVFTCSEFVTGHCIRNPRLLTDLVNTETLYKPFSARDYITQLTQRIAAEVEESSLIENLLNFRLQSMIRIIWRDVTGAADLFQTMAELSHLAEACIDQTFAYLYEQLAHTYGYPVDRNGRRQLIVVLGMGKLGARELNLSSDVDLIFAYPEAGHTVHAEKSVTNEAFFVKLCQRFLKLMKSHSVDGILFRVDMRLRPFGENGPIVMSFNNLEDYYQSQGREWERYALIKGRVVAGDKQNGRLLLERLKPFIYRRYFDYGSYDSLREMKQKINAEVIRKGMQNNIKLGRGGIREVEFFAQVFQLIRGGVDTILQVRSVLTALKLLVSEGYIPSAVCDELTAAYVFLRNTEHRLQAFADQQVHTLPNEGDGRLRLAYAMGFKDWDAFFIQLQQHMQRVHVHFDEILAGDLHLETDDPLVAQIKQLWMEPKMSPENIDLLEALGYSEGSEIVKLLELFHNYPETRALSHEGRDRIDKLMPIILRSVSDTDTPSITIHRIFDLVRTIEQRTCYIALILENSAVLDHLIKLAGASPWITNFLSQHPVLLDELLDSRTLFSPPEKKTLQKELQQRLQRVPADDIEFQIESTCVFKQINVLRVAAADITGQYPLMRVSDHLTDIAETVIAEVLEMAWHHMVAKYGRPQCGLDGRDCHMGFAVIGYGKLGGIEFGYGSDVDMVFVHAGTQQPTRGGQTTIDSAQFYVRLGQRMVHLLTSHTRAGRLYEVDMRLRPSGASGLLVTHLDAYEAYQAEDAWTWEHQALVRARIICGDPVLAARFDVIRRRILARPREQGALRKEIREMRERMRNEHVSADASSFDLKQSPGGIIDIEFLVQYLVLWKASTCEAVTRWTDNVRLLESLQAAAVLNAEAAEELKTAYLKLRSAIHLLNLKDKPGKVPLETFADIQRRVCALWYQFMENN